MNQSKVCVAYPNKNTTFSETFIRNQIRFINPDHLLTGGKWPFLHNGHRSIFSFPLNITLVRVFFKRLFPKYYHQFFTYALKRFLRKYCIGFVLAEYGPVGAMIQDACYSVGVKLVVHFHGYDASHQKTVEKFKNYYLKFNKQASNVIVVSQLMQRRLQDMGIQEEKFLLNPYGVDTTFFEFNEVSDEEVFIAVGRFTAKKSPLTTIKAFSRVLETHPNATLVMIGDGELRDDVHKLVGELSLQNAVLLKGILSPEEIRIELRKARCFVQHSVTSADGDQEGLPVSILEAMSTGLPIVSTRHAGIPEAVIHDENGFLVEEGDEEGMAVFMKELLAKDELPKKMGRRSREIILERFSQQRQIGNLVQLLS